MAITTGMIIIIVVVTALIPPSHSAMLTPITVVVSTMMHWELCVLEAAVGLYVLLGV